MKTVQIDQNTIVNLGAFESYQLLKHAQEAVSEEGKDPVPERIFYEVRLNRPNETHVSLTSESSQDIKVIWDRITWELRMQIYEKTDVAEKEVLE